MQTPAFSITDVDTYLGIQPEPMRVALEKLRQQIKTIVPDAEEYIGYGMPMYRYHGAMLVAFAAAKKHCGFYPCNSTAVSQFQEELKDYVTSKGAIRFTPEKPLPLALIKKIVKTRMKENKQKELDKLTKKRTR